MTPDLKELRKLLVDRADQALRQTLTTAPDGSHLGRDTTSVNDALDMAGKFIPLLDELERLTAAAAEADERERIANALMIEGSQKLDEQRSEIAGLKATLRAVIDHPCELEHPDVLRMVNIAARGLSFPAPAEVKESDSVEG